MASIFTKIIAREIPAYILAEDEEFIAFLDVFPLRKGHTLVVPKQEVNNAWDLEAEILSRWMVFAQPIAAAIQRSFPCNRCGVSIIGIEVPHAHMHLVPLDTADDLNFTKDKLQLSEADFEVVRKKIRAEL